MRATGTSSRVESTTTPVIPRFMDWIVTMWHFGVDAVHEYSGEKFNCKWELTQDIVASVYSKEWKISEKERNDIRKINGVIHGTGKSRIRMERQEYPKVTLKNALRRMCAEVRRQMKNNWIEMRNHHLRNSLQ